MHKKCRKTCHAFCKRIKMFKHYLWMNKYSELCSRFKAIFLCFCDCITNTVIHLCHPLKLVSSLALVTNPEPRIVNPSDIKAGKIRHLLGKCIIPCQKRIGSNNSHPTEIVVIKLVLSSSSRRPRCQKQRTHFSGSDSDSHQNAKVI